MENGKVGYKELLVAKSNKRYRKICRRMRLVLEDEK